MDLSIFKNPLFIAIVIGTMTYLYLYWDNEQTYIKNPKATKQTVGLLTPFVVTLISWFLASYFLGNISFGSAKGVVGESQLVQNQPQITGQAQVTGQPQIATQAQVQQAITEPVQTGGNSLNRMKIDNSRFSMASSDNMSYHLIGRNNIRLPQTDVFIDVAKF